MIWLHRDSTQPTLGCMEIKNSRNGHTCVQPSPHTCRVTPTSEWKSHDAHGKPSLFGWFPISNPPPPKISEEIPTCGPILGKTGSQCPGSESQAPNTPSLWLLSSWSRVDTQNISQLKKKNLFCLSVCTWSLSNTMAVQGGGPAVETLAHKLASVGSLPGPIFFHLLSLVLLRKLVFHAQTKPARRR